MSSAKEKAEEGKTLCEALSAAVSDLRLRRLCTRRCLSCSILHHDLDGLDIPYEEFENAEPWDRPAERLDKIVKLIKNEADGGCRRAESILKYIRAVFVGVQYCNCQKSNRVSFLERLPGILSIKAETSKPDEDGLTAWSLSDCDVFQEHAAFDERGRRKSCSNCKSSVMALTKLAFCPKVLFLDIIPTSTFDPAALSASSIELHSYSTKNRGGIFIEDLQNISRTGEAYGLLCSVVNLKRKPFEEYLSLELGYERDVRDNRRSFIGDSLHMYRTFSTSFDFFRWDSERPWGFGSLWNSDMAKANYIVRRLRRRLPQVISSESEEMSLSSDSCQQQGLRRREERFLPGTDPNQGVAEEIVVIPSSSSSSELALAETSEDLLVIPTSSGLRSGEILANSSSSPPFSELPRTEVAEDLATAPNHSAGFSRVERALEDIIERLENVRLADSQPDSHLTQGARRSDSSVLYEDQEQEGLIHAAIPSEEARREPSAISLPQTAVENMPNNQTEDFAYQSSDDRNPRVRERLEETQGAGINERAFAPTSVRESPPETSDAHTREARDGASYRSGSLEQGSRRDSHGANPSQEEGQERTTLHESRRSPPLTPPGLDIADNIENLVTSSESTISDTLLPERSPLLQPPLISSTFPGLLRASARVHMRGPGTEWRREFASTNHFSLEEFISSDFSPIAFDLEKLFVLLFEESDLSLNETETDLGCLEVLMDLDSIVLLSKHWSGDILKLPVRIFDCSKRALQYPCKTARSPRNNLAFAGQYSQAYFYANKNPAFAVGETFWNQAIVRIVVLLPDPSIVGGGLSLYPHIFYEGNSESLDRVCLWREVRKLLDFSSLEVLANPADTNFSTHAEASEYTVTTFGRGEFRVMTKFLILFFQALEDYVQMPERAKLFGHLPRRAIAEDGDAKIVRKELYRVLWNSSDSGEEEISAYWDNLFERFTISDEDLISRAPWKSDHTRRGENALLGGSSDNITVVLEDLLGLRRLRFLIEGHDMKRCVQIRTEREAKFFEDSFASAFDCRKELCVDGVYDIGFTFKSSKGHDLAIKSSAADRVHLFTGQTRTGWDDSRSIEFYSTWGYPHNISFSTRKPYVGREAESISPYRNGIRRIKAYHPIFRQASTGRVTDYEKHGKEFRKYMATALFPEVSKNSSQRIPNSPSDSARVFILEKLQELCMERIARSRFIRSTVRYELTYGINNGHGRLPLEMLFPLFRQTKRPSAWWNGSSGDGVWSTPRKMPFSVYKSNTYFKSLTHFEDSLLRNACIILAACRSSILEELVGLEDRIREARALARIIHPYFDIRGQEAPGPDFRHWVLTLCSSLYETARHSYKALIANPYSGELVHLPYCMRAVGIEDSWYLLGIPLQITYYLDKLFPGMRCHQDSVRDGEQVWTRLRQMEIRNRRPYKLGVVRANLSLVFSREAQNEEENIPEPLSIQNYVMRRIQDTQVIAEAYALSAAVSILSRPASRSLFDPDDHHSLATGEDIMSLLSVLFVRTLVEDTQVFIRKTESGLLNRGLWQPSIFSNQVVLRHLWSLAALNEGWPPSHRLLERESGNTSEVDVSQLLEDAGRAIRRGSTRIGSIVRSEHWLSFISRLASHTVKDPQDLIQGEKYPRRWAGSVHVLKAIFFFIAEDDALMSDRRSATGFQTLLVKAFDTYFEVCLKKCMEAAGLFRAAPDISNPDRRNIFWETSRLSFVGLTSPAEPLEAHENQSEENDEENPGELAWTDYISSEDYMDYRLPSDFYFQAYLRKISESSFNGASTVDAWEVLGFLLNVRRTALQEGRLFEQAFDLTQHEFQAASGRPLGRAPRVGYPRSRNPRRRNSILALSGLVYKVRDSLYSARTWQRHHLDTSPAELYESRVTNLECSIRSRSQWRLCPPNVLRETLRSALGEQTERPPSSLLRLHLRQILWSPQNLSGIAEAQRRFHRVTCPRPMLL